MKKQSRFWLPILLVGFATVAASGQSFRVQCPTSTITHPDPNNTGVNNAEPAYSAATAFTTGANGYQVPTANVNGAIKCQEVGGGDGYATMGDGTQTYMFSFGPLSGLTDIAAGLPGTQFPSTFNTLYTGPTLQPGDPATTVLGGNAFSFNGAVGQVLDVDAQSAGLCGGSGQ